MQIKLYKTDKFTNSTKLVTDARVTFNARLKDNCSKENPVFILTRIVLNDNNYLSCIFEDRTYYYFINNTTFVNDAMVEISCSMDYLATYRDEIINSTQYIERSSDPNLYEYGSNLTDLTYNAFNGIVCERKTAKIYSKVQGHYSVGLLCSGITHAIEQRGAVSYIIMNSEQIKRFINTLMSLTGAAADFNPIQYIVSCTFLPFNMQISKYFERVDESITFRNATVDIAYYYPTNSIATPDHGILPVTSFNFIIPDHPLLEFGNFMNYDPWMKLRIYIPCFGMYDIPMDYFRSERIIYGVINLDIVDGSAVLTIFTGALGNTSRLLVLNGIVGVPVQLAQITSKSQSDAMGVGIQLLGSLSSAINQNISGAVSGMASAVKSSYDSSIPTVSSRGSNGSMAPLEDEYVSLFVDKYLPCNINIDRIGKIVNHDIVINSAALGHFIKCNNAKLNVYADKDEKETIENMLNEGFYYE